MAFSPDGNVLASGDANNNVRLWDISTPGSPITIGAFAAPQGSSLVGISLPIRAYGGRLAETIANDATGHSAISLWDISASSLIGRLCAGTGDAVTASQWRQYVPGQPYRPPYQASG